MQQRARIEYLGSADAAGLVNAEPYGCRRATVYKKAGVAVDDPEAHRVRFENDEGPVARGVELERNIRERIALKVGVCHAWAEPQITELMPPRPPVPEWLEAHPDGIVGPLDQAQAGRLARLCGITDPALRARLVGVAGIVEGKTVQLADLMRIRKEGPRQDHVLQVYHQLCATAAPFAVLVYLNADQWRWLYFIIWREPEWEQVNYLPAAVEAWSQIARAKAGINPADSPDEWEPLLPPRLAEGSKACQTCDHAGTCWGSELMRVRAAATGDIERIEGSAEWDEAVQRAIEARAIVDDAEMIQADADAVLKNLLGDRVLVETPGAKIHYKPVTTNRIDVTKLKADLPDVAAKYTKASESRPLRIYPKKS